jgi:DNA primase
MPTEQKNHDSKLTVPLVRRVAILTAFSRAARLKPDHPAGHSAFKYLAARGISPATVWSAGVGFAGCYREVQKALLNRIPLEELQAVGLFNERGNFRLWKHRLVLPFWLSGQVYGLQARNIDWRGPGDGPKELLIGSPVLPFHTDGLLEPGGEVFIAEGAMDTLSLLEVGLNAVGIPGASGFKREWVRLFDGFAVILALDNDPAGREGAQEILNHFAAAGRPRPRVLSLPEGCKDVNDFLRASY